MMLSASPPGGLRKRLASILRATCPKVSNTSKAVSTQQRGKGGAEYGAEVEKMKGEAEQGRREQIGKAKRGETGEKISI